MSLTLYGIQGCFNTLKALIAAKYADKAVELKAPEAAVHPLGCTCCPALVDESVKCRVNLFGAAAVAKYIAKGSSLLPPCEYGCALVDSWIEFAGKVEQIFEPWIMPLILDKPACGEALKAAKGESRKILASLDKYLLSRTFLVGQRVSLADIIVFCALYEPYKRVLDKGFRKQFVNVNRWFTTIAGQPNVIAVVGETVLCEKAQNPKVEEVKKEEPKKGGKKEEPKKAEKKEEKKEEKKDEEEEPKPEKKPKNPLDLLPPSPFVMDEWKVCYSNNDTVSVAAPWFFEHMDPEGYCFYFCKYKYELTQPMGFMVSNLIGGWLQRIEPLRKYGFGSICYFGEPKNFEIEGFWIFRGQQVPPEMTVGDDYELYEWTRINPLEHKEKITELLAWEGKFDGRKFVDGKVFK